MSTLRTSQELADRTRRREVVRRLHPDLGGDPGEFIAALRALSERSRVGHGSPAPVVAVSTQVPLKALRRTHRHFVGDLRRRLPRSLPGSRRFVRL